MALLLPPNAYGERTEDLQQIISDAEGMRLFTRPAVRPEAGAVASLVKAHLAALENLRGPVPVMAGVRLGGREDGDVDALWARGQTWRDAVGRAIGDLYLRHGARGVAQLRPPIWPVGKINVFGVVIVATEEGLARGTAMRHGALQKDICWEFLCFAETLLDASLVAALFGDRASEVFSPLLSLMRAGAMPMGYDHDFFACFEFGVDREGIPSSRRFSS